MDVDSSMGEPGEGGTARKRVSTACEACRATKIKCQPSEQPGVCRKCLDSKRECISRTGPRTRRRRTKIVLDGPQEAPAPLTPVAGPSKTFTIDFDVPSQPEVDENFDTLRDSHDHFLESIFTPEAGPDPLSFASSPMNGFPTPPASTHTQTHSIQSLHGKPQFNLESASSLLASFRGMLGNYPCILLKPEETVSSLAASRPFVLLAILAAASGSRTLQGHNLYDEEFRKVLGLKFVAGGERSLELLQGILIYCAWYPFHLRPKNKQALQYIRMASDLVYDMELDQAPQEMTDMANLEATAQQLDKTRAYLAWWYSVSAYVSLAKSERGAKKPRFIISWKKMNHLAAPFTAWTAACCDVLERNAEWEGDLVLTTLMRISKDLHAANEALYGKNEDQNQLMFLGLEARHRDLKQKMLPHVARTTPTKIADLFFDLYLDGGALLRVPRARPSSPDFIPASSAQLRRCIPTLKNIFAYTTSLDRSAFISFTNNDWIKFILSVIVSIRLSFALPECPDWDAGWARSELRLDEFLTKICDGEDLTPVSTRVDVLSASRVVLRVVKNKYDCRVAALNTPAQTTPGLQRCPMLDGSLEQYFPVWDAGFGSQTNSGLSSRAPEGQPQTMFHDLWATMTMGWANDEPSNTI